MTRNTICSDCGGRMEKGHIVTELDAWGRILDGAFWLEGNLENGWMGFVKTKGKRQYYLLAYRCEHCGLIKFYAGPSHKAQENS